jgi:protein involved in polysaccharide export with SLBB domain
MKGDRIFVRDTIDVRELAKITLKGEVKAPGVYPIQPGVTKLSWIIKNAGGFTPNAFLGGGSVIRKRLDLETNDITPAQDAGEVTRLANLSVSDTANFKLQTNLRKGAANVDMNRIFVHGDSTADLTLRDGDVISIPVSSNDVLIWGYVGRSGYVPYAAGANLQHYIDLAGGYAEGSVRSGTRIIKAHTRQYLDPDQTQIEQGDEIYVPKTPDHSENYTLNTVGAVAGIIGGLVGTALAILYFTKR